MYTDHFGSKHNIIISLDVDKTLPDQLLAISKSGYKRVEINTSSQDLLTEIIEQFPTLHIGAGLIKNTLELEKCYLAGVAFATSPGFLPAIAQTASIYSIDYIPGISTISEAMQAMNLGCKKLRPYPSSIELCVRLNSCLPDAELYPADVELEELEQYFSIPAVHSIAVQHGLLSLTRTYKKSAVTSSASI